MYKYQVKINHLSKTSDQFKRKSNLPNTLKADINKEKKDRNSNNIHSINHKKNTINITYQNKSKNKQISTFVIDHTPQKHTQSFNNKQSSKECKQFNQKSKITQISHSNHNHNHQNHNYFPISKNHTKSLLLIEHSQNSPKKFKKQTQKSILDSTHSKHSNITTRRKLSIHNPLQKQFIKQYSNTKMRSSKKTQKNSQNKNKDQSLSQQIKLKYKDFKVISHCLKQYAQEERSKGNFPSHESVFKLIKAFNKSQIGVISKPLQKLIENMITSINQNLYDYWQKQKQHQNKRYQKGVSRQYERAKTCYDNYNDQNENLLRKKEYENMNQQNKQKNEQINEIQEQKNSFGLKQGIQLQIMRHSLDLQGMRVKQRRIKQQIRQKGKMSKQQKLQEIKRLQELVEYQQQVMQRLQRQGVNGSGQYEMKMRVNTYNSQDDIDYDINIEQ